MARRKPIPRIRQWVSNARTKDCVWESIEQLHRCERVGVPARVLVYGLTEKLFHAVCVYSLKGRVCVYDAAKGTTWLPAGVNLATATAADIVRHLYSGTLKSYWFEDMPS